jgi:anti-sigma regulatory factor (Ser/Thr protein kinase)
MRRAVFAFLEGQAVPVELIWDFLLACDEAFINSFMHGGDVEGMIGVSVSCCDDHVCVVVEDHGCGFDAEGRDLGAQPDPLLDRGRGLFIIHQLMDEVELVSGGDGTTVRMTKKRR